MNYKTVLVIYLELKRLKSKIVSEIDILNIDIVQSAPISKYAKNWNRSNNVINFILFFYVKMDNEKTQDKPQLDLKTSIFDMPVGKNFLTLISVYSFLLAVFALTYDKNWFLFLTLTSYVILLYAGIALVIIGISLLSYYSNLIKAKQFEFVTINTIIQLVSFFAFSYFLNSILAKRSWTGIISVLIIEAPLITVIIYLHTFNTAFYLHENFGRIDFTSSLNHKFLVSHSSKFWPWILIINDIAFSTIYGIYMLSNNLVTIIDRLFVGQLIAGLCCVSLLYCIDLLKASKTSKKSRKEC
ncbi:MAG: hypothetical protein K9W46_00020 [Candidatus Heimdallarchaeum endolithica]|uniref:Uncharacterized protein n=1 Tax=Candidatus Heimdallarchaeum endolithica TaxID=2876572 RepID=A0A9Y1BR89_9ARCH|nr:MAG: hypothetical protein K9W46_00020 [Candidatus Heimdallarchaeum endolithica]